MSTQFTNRQWRLPNNENKDKQSNYSMDFDGNIQRVTASNFSGLANKNSGSFSLWFKTTNTTTNAGKCIFSIPYSANGNGFDVYINNSTSLKSYLKTTTFTTTTTNTITYGDGNWHHVAVVYDGSTHKIYFDTVDVTNTSAPTPSGAIAASTVNTLEIGRFSSSYANEFNGQIDAVSIFDYALTDGTGGTVNQIATLYGSSSTGIGNPMAISGGGKPVAYYPLGDQDAFNGADYLVPNSSLKDYVFDFGTYTDNKYITINNTFDSIITSTNFTISAWFKLNSVASNQYKYIFTNESLQFAITNTVNVYRRGTSGSYLGILTGGTSLNINTWYNAVVTKNGNDYTLFLNAQSDRTLYDSLAIANSNKTTSRIGMYYTDNTYGLDGKLSNVQIFNTALPATGSNSIETLYNNGSPLTSMTGFTSLQGWWKLDATATYDGTDWSIPDDSSNSNDGTSSGMTQSALQQSDLSFKTSYSPYALDFDGANDQINSGSNLGISGASARTFSAWVKTTDGGGSYDVIVATGNSGNTGNNFELDFRNNVIMWERWGLGIMGSVIVNDGNWHHACITYDGNILKLYVDGSEDTGGDFPYTIGATTSTDTPVRIGGMNHSAKYFNGSISNVSIWNATLTSAQVSEIYAEGIPQNLNNHSAYSNLVSWWQLGSNTSWVDPYWISLDEKGTNNGESQNVAAPNNMGENAIVDGVGSYANGLSSGMSDNIVGSAPFSDANSLSVNMDVLDRVEDTPS